MKSVTGLILLVIIGLGIYTVNQREDDTSSVNKEEVEVVDEETVTLDIVTEEVEEKEDILDLSQKKMKAIITTNKGVIELELFNDLAPKTVENFTKLAMENFYDGVKFHRVIKDFIIQSGDPLSKDDELDHLWGTGDPGYKFEDEIHAENENNKGTISMANSGPDTNGSQFFLNVNDNNFLDPKHTVFGKVTMGIENVEAIENVETLPNDRPVDPVIIESIEII